MKRCFPLGTLLAGFLAMAVGPALLTPIHAADDFWDNNPGGNWENGLNWQDGSTPGNFDTATFNLASTYNVTFGVEPAAIQALYINAASGAVTFQSSGAVARTLGISSLTGGSNRMFVLGGSTLNVGGAAGNPMNLYIVNGLFVANNGTMLARSASNVNTVGTLEIGSVIDGNPTTGTATYTIQSAATMQLGGNLVIATNGVTGINGVLNIIGSNSSLTQYNNVDVSNVTVGSIFGGTGAINISTNGTMTTGNGQLTVNKTGTVSVNTTATLNVNGNVLVDGGLLTDSGNFNWATGRTMSIINGGDVNFNFDYFTPSNGVMNVSGTGSTLTTTGLPNDFSIVAGATVSVANQGLLSLGGTLSVGNAANVGTVVNNGVLSVDGLGTRAEALSTTTANVIGANGNLALVSFTNQSVGSFAGGIALAKSTTAGTTAVLTVASGADLVNMGNIEIANAGGTTTSATMTITGSGSTVSLAASKVLTIGHASAGVATVNVNDGGSLILGTGGSTILNATGTININGGTVSLQDFSPGGGKINFNSGTLSYLGSATIGAGGLLGTNLTLTANHKLTNSATTINSGSMLLIESGAGFTTGTLANSGQVVLSGIDAVANATTTNNTGLIRGEGRIVGTFNNNANGELRAETGKLIATQGANGTNLGRVNLLGGTAQFSNALTNGTAGTIIGRGTLIVGGTGLTNNGNVSLSSGISDVYGDVNNSTGVATRGVTVSGNADVTFWDDVTNGAGSLFKVTINSSATFFGTYSGGGITGGGNVYFEGDISPGFSPAAVLFQNNVSLSDTAKLNIELGGTTAGSQYDQVTVNGTLTLDGILNVLLINGFVPQSGQSFDILNWTSLSGTFSSIQLPSLASGLSWNTSQLYTDGVLSVGTAIFGDFDADGDVDGADFIAWQVHYPTSSGATTATGDANGDGRVDGADFAIWQNNFPISPSPAAPVPEPAAWLLCIAAVLPAYFLGRGAGRRTRSSAVAAGSSDS